LRLRIAREHQYIDVVLTSALIHDVLVVLIANVEFMAAISKPFADVERIAIRFAVQVCVKINHDAMSSG
jgi:hypothetical protein